MGRVRFHVAGESHSSGLIAVAYGLPAGIPIDPTEITSWMGARRSAAGRGDRQDLEVDRFEFLSGVRDGVTTGGPLAILLPNKDCSGGSVAADGKPVNLEFPRPGHADYSGATKWGLTDATVIAEQASARITAAYVAMGAVFARFLRELGVDSFAHVSRLGSVRPRRRRWKGQPKMTQWRLLSEGSRFATLRSGDEEAMARAIAEAREEGDTLGGEVEVVFSPVPVGLGNIQPIDARLDARFAGALMGIPGVRAVVLGDGLDGASLPGSAFHDQFVADGTSARRSNHAGGIEGGMTNGEPVVVRAVVKPIPTLGVPLASQSLKDGRPGKAAQVRSDVTAVPALAWIARSLSAWVLTDAIMQRYGGDRLEEIKSRLR